MEKQFLITEDQLQAILESAKTSEVFAEETHLEGETVLDVFIANIPRYSLQQGVPLGEPEE